MELRVIDEHSVELYQPPTANWQLESCGRYQLLDDGVIEYSFECIPRAGGYRHGYIGMFWASYIEQPESGAIWFRGAPRSEPGVTKWIEATSSVHGTDSTHGPAENSQLPQVDDDFPLTLVNHPSPYVYRNRGILASATAWPSFNVSRPRSDLAGSITVGRWIGQSGLGLPVVHRGLHRGGRLRVRDRGLSALPKPRSNCPRYARASQGLESGVRPRASMGRSRARVNS